MRPWKTEELTRRRFLAATALACLSGATVSVGVGEVRAGWPASGSFSREGLERVSDYMRNEVAAGRIPGAIVLIRQHGKPVYYEKFGVIDVAGRQPMTDDAIFRLYSMSKPITSVAAMMLIEDGKLALNDPLSKYIPAFADVRVGVEKHDENGKTTLALEPLQRPITIEDLLRQTSGITYGFYGDSAVRKLYANSDLFEGDLDNAEFVARLAKLPLAEQPATKWDYGHSTDVLGRIIEVVSGESLFEFEKTRLLDPLGMNETAFYIADPTKRSWVAEPLANDHLTGPVVGLFDPTVKRRWEAGGVGMVGTTGDYARFAQMLLNGGSLDGKRYLRPATVALMTSDHIGPETKIARDEFYFPGADSGFGFGFAVRTTTPSHTKLPIGEYGWDGVGGTFFFVDPRDDMFAICMMQSPLQRGRIETEMKTLVYHALVSP